jgi:hypothetical protein
MIDEKKIDEREENWISETGLDCHIYPCDFGNGRYHLCGYVRIPADHPLYKVDYSALVPQALIDAREKVLQEPIGKRGIIDVLCMGSDAEMRSGVLFNVHGGITFSGPFRDGDPTDFWYGFDCGHCDDNNDRCNAAYVRGECESLAQQIVALGCPLKTKGDPDVHG